MAQRNSNQDTDGVTWSTTALRLGSEGMDLRKPTEPASLADLINARFLDERTIERRDGHAGQDLQDGVVFTGNVAPAEWVYGHGQRMSSGIQDAPYPIHRRGGITFSLVDNDVVWTGDRLLVPRDGGNHAIGASTFWQRADDQAAGDLATKAYQRGTPAFLPLMTDGQAPSIITGTWVESCLSETLRVYTYVAGAKIFAITLNRTTGLVIDETEITGSSTAPVEPTIMMSGTTPAIFFRDTNSLALYVRFWTGSGWSLENVFGSATAYDAVATTTGVKLTWLDSSTIKMGSYTGNIAQAPFAATLTTSATPTGALALAVAADGTFGVAYDTASGIAFDEYNSSGTATGYALAPQAGLTAARGLSLTVRALTNAGGGWEWIMHSCTSGGIVTIESFSAYATSIATGGYTLFTTAHRYNSVMLSRAFMVGDEVFCWLKSNNAFSAYLLAGATHPIVAGYADRETAITPPAPGSGYFYWPSRISTDPLNAASGRSWTRQFNTGISSKTGNVLSGSIDFLPHSSAAIYGKSAYLSGSAVKNYDGIDMNDAGYQDFPVVASSTPSGTGGSLTTAGLYWYLVRAARYNNVGERFESAARIYVAPTLTGSDNIITLTISTIPSISGPASSPDTNDVVLEVYRTETTGTTFYLEGTVANNLAAATVSFTSEMADTDLIKQIADPHATGVGNQQEIESFGPVGCAVLTTVGDRLWGAGGQLLPGVVQFSKLKDVGFAAGFDDLAGYLQVDNENGQITSLTGQNGSLVVFELTRAYVYSDSGPDNFGNGAFGGPQLTLSAGALNHFGTGLCQQGVLYWGAEGPLLLDRAFTVQNISSPMRPLTSGLSPTGIRIDTDRMEAVWYCGEQAVLWNFMGGTSRWARWTTPNIVSVSNYRALTATGRLLIESPSALGDDGVPFDFTFRTGDLRPEALREGFVAISRVGVAGQYFGPHRLRMRVFFDGSPCWSEESVWHPKTKTWLTECTDFSSMTPTAIDALGSVDQSGAYSTNKRLRRETCRFIAIEVSDISSLAPTYIPFELAFEMGAKPGLGRVASTTFTGQNR